ncbi:hypothetical protein ED312_19530 [Sinomicrobium pectinilyticum]|uniref:Uncharacterized protein n=1 Tax=Sinomicrobium pectinilyticum TaxID=1084421 RepID=A0A3N0DR69_SINP1|nr:hypothetical protein ED312_19530 [Sinomicrobium pectinilyticum]
MLLQKILHTFGFFLRFFATGKKESGYIHHSEWTAPDAGMQGMKRKMLTISSQTTGNLSHKD